MPEPMPNPDVRWRQRFQNYQHALGELRDAARLASERDLSKLEQQGLIKAFEFTYELGWNTLKDLLELRGVPDVIGSRDAIRAAFRAGLIEEGEIWMEMMKHRNRSAHTYDEAVANEIATAILAQYVSEFVNLEQRLSILEPQK